MIFTKALTVPAGTAAETPVEAEIELAVGIIHKIEITFLDGPENEVHVVVKRPGLHQIFPTHESSIIGNAITVEAVLDEPVEDGPLKVVVQAWSPDAGFAHEVTVRVHVLDRKLLHPPNETVPLIRKLSRAILGGS